MSLSDTVCKVALEVCFIVVCCGSFQLNVVGHHDVHVLSDWVLQPTINHGKTGIKYGHRAK